MANRPKYYIGRSILIYLLTILTGTTIDSIILSMQQSNGFWSGVLDFFGAGIIITGVVCIPILFILIFGFHYIYKKSRNHQQKWKGIQLLSLTCSILPLAILVGGELIIYFKVNSEDFIWLNLMIPYAVASSFYTLYISHRDDLKNPPIFPEHTTELEGVLDSGFEDDF